MSDMSASFVTQLQAQVGSNALRRLETQRELHHVCRGALAKL